MSSPFTPTDGALLIDWIKQYVTACGHASYPAASRYSQGMIRRGALAAWRASFAVERLDPLIRQKAPTQLAQAHDGRITIGRLPPGSLARPRHRQQGDGEPKHHTDAGPDVADAVVIDLEPGRRGNFKEEERLYECTGNTRRQRRDGQHRNPAAEPIGAAGATRHLNADPILRSASSYRITQPVETPRGRRTHRQFCVTPGICGPATHPASDCRIAQTIDTHPVDSDRSPFC